MDHLARTQLLAQQPNFPLSVLQNLLAHFLFSSKQEIQAPSLIIEFSCPPLQQTILLSCLFLISHRHVMLTFCEEKDKYVNLFIIAYENSRSSALQTFLAVRKDLDSRDGITRSSPNPIDGPEQHSACNTSQVPNPHGYGTAGTGRKALLSLVNKQQKI